LGWPDDERLRKQQVLLDIKLQFPADPKACTTDNLDDTCCYRALIDSLRGKLHDKKFHLIEHVTYEIYQQLKSDTPAQTLIHVSLSKKPLIEGLGGVTFHYGDLI
jgi:dihydroneopterin aldolase